MSNQPTPTTPPKQPHAGVTPGSVTPAWHSQSPEAVAQALTTSLIQGLDPAEAARRLATHGPNELREAPRPPFWRLVLAQFTSFVVMILIVASLISAVLGEWVEAIAIMAIVLLNAIIGVVQESRAEAALAALKKLAAPNALVLRGGHRLTIPSHELVPGDVVVLEDGNYIPADVRLVETVNLRIEEAALTGESLPVEKHAQADLEADLPLGDRVNMAFMGTMVTRGRGRGVVTGTGMQTQMGLIAEMLSTLDNEPTPLQQRLEELGKQLGTVALIVCALVFLVATWQQTDIAVLTGQGLGAYLREYSAELSEFFLVAIGLAIAAVPEGLPAVVTITLAIGMREMVRRHALIRRLASVETLGAASVICSDKTGTLTQNQMTVRRLWVDNHLFSVTGEGYEPRGEFKLNEQVVDLTQYPAALTALWAGNLASDAYVEAAPAESGKAYRVVGDPTEGAIVVAAAKAGALKAELEKAYPRVNEVPFDSERKRMSTLLDVRNPRLTDPSPYHEGSEHNGPLYAITTKGAPDVILKLCTHYQGLDDAPRPMTEEQRFAIFEANEHMAQQALRVLAVAYRTTTHLPEPTADAVEHDLVFLGLFGMIDPPRPEVPPAVEKARRAGIRAIMITGDYPDTAEAIATSIGLLKPGRQVLPGSELDQLDEAGLVKALDTTDVFARVNPQHKVRIVEALRQKQEVVAMTGDGVNDAPALKRADIGVAMGITGTDVAKETADMVLTDDNFASIVAAVEQGRIIYANIRKFVFFLLSSNVAEIMIIFLATLAGLPSPLTPIQLLWLNLVTDGAPALALAMEKGDPDVMDHKPRPKKEPIVHGPMRLGIGVQTVFQTFAVLAAFATGLLWHLGATPLASGNPLMALIEYDWAGVDVQTAETMAFVTLSLAELFRAFTVRSERLSIFQIGVFSNKYLVGAVALSITLLLLTVFVPFLQPIFNTHALTLREWEVVLGLALLPAVAEEVTKWFLRRQKS
ncbi:MAG: cation-translocating P-type ATPase [Anaerolineales bacterium]|nr:cation-translocating P-type ATPase [Anaerolineales bacterium]